MCLNEIKLNEEECNFRLRFKGYHTYFRLREGESASFGGGVCVLIKENFCVEEITSDLNSEAISLSINIENFKLKLLSYYNPRNISSSLIDTFMIDSKNSLIIGDLNAKNQVFGCKSSNVDGFTLEEIINRHNLIILNNEEPTYFQHGTNYTEKLDLALASNELAGKVSNFEVMSDYLMGSDHAPISVKITIDQHMQQKNIQKASNKFNFKKADWIGFAALLDEAASIFKPDHFENVDAINSFITTKIAEAASITIPVSSASGKQKIPKDILILIKEKKKKKRKQKENPHLLLQPDR